MDKLREINVFNLMEVNMGTIKNRTTLNGQILTLVSNKAVGELTTKHNSFDAKFENEMTR